MDESSNPERHDGGTSRAAGKHQAGGTNQSGGKHQVGKTICARGKHQAGGKSHSGPKRQAGKHAASSHGTASLGAAASGATPGAGPRSGIMTVSRRKLLVSGGALAAGFAGLDTLRNLAVTPVRVAADPATASLANAHGDLDLPDVQFNLAGFTAPAVTVNGVLVAFPPVFTLFATAQLMSTPSKEDQDELAGALDRIEKVYQFAPQGIFTFLAYGLPYFNRFPGKLFESKVPRLLSGETRFVLEEAVPSPTDVSPANPGITKERFNVPVVIEANDLLFTLRSDNTANLQDVLAFLGGSDMLAGQKVPSPRLKCGLTFTSTRLMFAQRGMPRAVADQNNLVFAPFVHPNSPMWMGFADQQVNASAPAPDVTFAGADGIHLTTAQPGDYLDNGSLQHLSHVILDMHQWFDLNAAGNPGEDGTFLEHVQYMFRSDPPPSKGFKNQFLNAGGPAFLPNVFQGTGDAARSAVGVGTLPNEATGVPEHRMGHLSTLQRSSRTADGRPLHVRMDGPGFDSMDIPDGTKQPKLEFTVFVPSADFFATMRRNQASLDLAKKFNVATTDNGLERFITATRRQNFLIPPRRHRAFPFAEFLGEPAGTSPAESKPARSSSASSNAAGSGSGSGGSGGGGGGRGGDGGGGH
jgi:uncharacterized membrane protein YgcG